MQTAQTIIDDYFINAIAELSGLSKEVISLAMSLPLEAIDRPDDLDIIAKLEIARGVFFEKALDDFHEGIFVAFIDWYRVASLAAEVFDDFDDGLCVISLCPEGSEVQNRAIARCSALARAAIDDTDELTKLGVIVRIFSPMTEVGRYAVQKMVNLLSER